MRLRGVSFVRVPWAPVLREPFQHSRAAASALVMTRATALRDQVRQQQVPIIGEGQGVYSFVHIDDAAGATAAALECPPGAYNIVDGNPSPQHLWLTAFARAAGAPAPPRVSEEEALRASGPDAVYYATRLRGASNEKAGRELEFRPRPLEWIVGQRSD